MNSDSNTPLLNEYKFRYVCKVLPQTFLGGIRLRIGFDAPCFIYFFQIVLWMFPIVIGIIFTVIAELTDTRTDLCGIFCGIVTFVLHILFHVVVFLSMRKTVAEKQKHNFLAEEDEIEFTSCFSLTSLEFISPKKLISFNYFLHPLINGVICCFALLFLLPTRCKYLFDSDIAAVTYFILGWIVVCATCYPLTGQSPKEPAIFYDHIFLELNLLTRSCYVFFFLLFDYFTRSYSQFDNINYGLHILFIFLPFLWTAGALPPIDCLLLWSAEQVLIHLFGATAMATNGRLLINFIFSWLSMLVFYFITDSTIHVVVMVFLATLLTTDVPSFVIKTLTLVKVGPARIKTDKHFTSSVRNNVIQTYCSIIFIVSACMIMTGVIESKSSFLKDRDTVDMFGFVFASLLTIYKLLQSSLKVYILFGCIKNPLQFSCRMKNVMVVVLYVYKAFILPLYLVFALGVIIIPTHRFTFIYCLLLFRLYRLAWQDTLRCSYDVIVYFIIQWSNFDPLYWQELQPSLKIFIISMILHTFVTLLRNVWFVIILTVNSFQSQKDQKRKVTISLIISVCCLPLSAAVIIISSIISAPLLPLFTLPILLIGFPRPLRMWPHSTSPSKSSSADWIYYQHLMPELVKEIQSSVLASHLDVNPGSYYLARFQDRLIWISVLESGLMYCNFVVKGLELQETSCHTTEAQFIDDIFEDTFAPSSTTIYNKLIFSVLTPITEIQLETYSDAQNILTGIIDNPEYLQNVSKNFPKIFLWNLVRHCLHRRQKGLEDAQRKYPLQSVDREIYVHETKMSNISSPDVINKNDEILITKGPIVQMHETVFSGSFSIGDSIELQVYQIPQINPMRNDNENDSDDEFADFGFGSDNDSEGSDDDTSGDSTMVDHNQNNFVVSIASVVLDPPSYWKTNLPYTDLELSSYFHLYSTEWYTKIIKSLNLSDEELIIDDTSLMKIFRLLVMTCYYLIDVISVADNSVIKEGSGHVYHVFHGELPWSPHISWIDDDEELKDLVIKSYRLAFKLSYDSEVYGETVDDDELLSILTNYTGGWFIGDDTSEEWMENVLNGTPNLLSFGRNKKMNIFTSRTLSKQKITVPIAEINPQSVRGLWSALSLELYYMTNDDDERYSIQALPPMLRNITTQAADVPLGYPVYISGLVSIPI